ncbi:MAG: SUMF1/EgtB/PvdO family nonheme iron enzyme [Trichodesmium erythraeum GBRTRLIN201]|nr:SUMF1/EgtB/PvdO family nonheme iron enzyme [Trichodesmium erythraeum GBRTRLIN201]
MTNQNIAITIGVQEYEFLTPLKYAANDAKKMRDFLLDEADFDDVFYLSDNSPKINGASTRPTRSRLELVLEDEVKKLSLKTGDNLWFFFSGHGHRENNNIDYLIPIDGHSNVERSGISVDYIIQQLQKSGADNIVLILDACRNKSDGGKGGEGLGRQTEQEAREKGIVTIFSCSPNERSWELEELQQGVFTYALLEGLGSKGQKATAERLNEYLKYRVQELAQKEGKRQTPRIIADPIEKSHLILMPKYATKTDVSTLKIDAYRAQTNGDFNWAEQLWIRVLEVGLDLEAVKALQKIAVDRFRSQLVSTPQLDLGYFQNLPVSETQQPRSTEVLEGSNIQTSLQSQRKLEPNSQIKTKSQPKITIHTFATPKVNRKGEIISRSEGEAEVMIENLGNGVTLEMVKIPGGSFLMGSPETEAQRSDNEGPQHHVDVPEFWMGKYVVTQQQWQAIMGNDPSKFKGKNRPVECVSWNNATEFCQKLSKKTGRDYRLPSEAEWEYACRAGTTTPFYFGETITGELANYRASETYADEPKGEYREQTTPVGEFPPNAFGLYDMHGNVWEWCQDVVHSNYDGAPVDGSAWVNGGDSSGRVLRGGSWLNYPGWCRSASRGYYVSVVVVSSNFGFRLVSFPPRTPE